MPFLQDAYQNSLTGGGVGADALRLTGSLMQGAKDRNPLELCGSTAGGNYCGILVLPAAAWALAQSLRRKNLVFASRDRLMICFFGLVAWPCLLVFLGAVCFIDVLFPCSPPVFLDHSQSIQVHHLFSRGGGHHFAYRAGTR